ncbi:NAD(P)-binding domain-containing protein [Nocardioides sp. AX2bis]|uniref:NAD(P)-binding domain-containing protein n=1 Tax=Nocardioides sp. AX2bis TaxID=2653157 RepID=UPI0012F3B09E|nr:NAD(P)-binding domain-containing protein [Nocardioides sp. AX2bis]VXB14089.1 Pyridine nucleotide-disulfide oxidoreductase [Nocardioides sp. AX2bis]
MEVLDAVVVGAGQAGLSTSFHLRRRGVEHVVLDGDAAPGGAWQHRWDSLTMRDVHGVAALPDAEAPTGDGPANLVVPASFAAYERDHQLPVERPVTVRRVEDAGDGSGLLVVHTDRGDLRTRTLVSATGTWTRPFVPSYPGRDTFVGPQWHTHDYPGPEAFRGLRTAVVGGGASAVQLLGEVAPVTDTLWFTRRPPVWRTDDFTPEAGRAAVAMVEDRVRRGLPPASVVSVTGLVLREQEHAAADLGAYRRRAMFTALEADAVRLPDGTREPVDAVLWATGFRPAVGHLAPLRLRSERGGITLDGTTAVADPRVQLVGYGPSASTIGATRAGRAAARAVAAWLERRGDLSPTG